MNRRLAVHFSWTPCRTAPSTLPQNTGHWVQWEPDLFNRMAIHLEFSEAIQTSDSGADSVFGQVQLGYLVVESRSGCWIGTDSGADAIGLHVDGELSRDALRFRLDEHQCRFLIRRGPAEDLTAIRLAAIADHSSFDQVLKRGRPRSPHRGGHRRGRYCYAASSAWRFGPKACPKNSLRRHYSPGRCALIIRVCHRPGGYGAR